MTRDVHRTLTDAIMRQIEAGPGPWRCPWHRDGGGLPTNALTGHAYRGINIVSLWCAEQANGFVSGRWATYRQWATLGAQVRRGAQGTPVLFYKDLARPDTGSTGRPSRPAGEDGPDHPRFVARASWVFNAAQVEGAPAEPPPPTISGAGPTPDLDRFVQATGALIREGESACYLPGPDEIRMPTRARFTCGQGYAATLLHELVHWTGHTRRLDRQLTTRFGTCAYAAEELVAELGAAFTLAGLGLASTPHPNHASYLAHWLPLLQADPRALVTAAAHASRAADHLAALQTGPEAGGSDQVGNGHTGQGAAA